MKEFWNERYRQTDFVYGETPNEYLKTQLSKMTCGNILFPCEGEGRNAVYAAQLGWDVYAFDQSEEGKNKAMHLAQTKQVSIDYLVSDVEQIPYENETFDALVLIFAHFPNEKRRKYHQKMASLLKKGGTLIIEGFGTQHAELQKINPNACGPKKIEMLYDLEALKTDFSNFEFIEEYQAETELNEGKYHAGTAFVVRVLAIKKG